MLLFSTSLLASEQEALQAIKSLGTNLKKELQKAMKISKVNAVKTCNVKAMAIAKEASKKGIEVGRVSTKNRNPNNFPKEWMKPYIEKFHKKEIKDPYVVISLPNGKKGLLKPIATMPMCLNCHGTKIDADVMEEIKKHYPNDKAIGYKVGDIRGFFWAEYKE